jgi:hypothetical protein
MTTREPEKELETTSAGPGADWDAADDGDEGAARRGDLTSAGDAAKADEGGDKEDTLGPGADWD